VVRLRRCRYCRRTCVAQNVPSATRAIGGSEEHRSKPICVKDFLVARLGRADVAPGSGSVRWCLGPGVTCSKSRLIRV
jgi:hypothetical protein